MIQRTVFFVIFCFLGSYALYGQTCPSTFNYQSNNNAGTWTTSGDWNSAPPYPTNSSYTYGGTTYTNCVIIPPGDIVQITSSNFTLTGANLVVQGTLTFDQGKLKLDAGKVIIVPSGGLVCCTGTCNASDVISVGGNNVWGGGGGSTDPVSGPAISDGSTVLPIVLEYFKASFSKEKIQLTWATSSEINFDYFNLEKSTDGENFSSIGKIAGHGLSHEFHEYSIVDQNPIVGKNYYRLTSVDFDGKTETFKVVSLNYSSEKGFHISPNPSDGMTLDFNLNYAPDREYIIAIYDNVGNVVDRLKSTNKDQVLSYTNSLSSGVYYAKLITEDFVKVERFIVK